MTDTITSPSNPLIKRARSLRQLKARRESKLFLVEGVLHVGEAVAAGWELDCLLYAPDLLSSDFAKGLVAEQAGNGVRCQPISRQALETIAEKENPQGILAVVRQREWSLADLAQAHFDRGVVLVSPQDPGNVGSILRTLDAVGADGLFLVEGGADPFQPASVRASMGALFWKPVIQTTFAAAASWARQRGFRLIGTSAHASVDYRNARVKGTPWLLLMGSEQKGLSAEQAGACDLLVSLPMRGRATSLNLAVAAGVLLYALMEDGH